MKARSGKEKTFKLFVMAVCVAAVLPLLRAASLAVFKADDFNFSVPFFTRSQSLPIYAFNITRHYWRTMNGAYVCNYLTYMFDPLNWYSYRLLRLILLGLIPTVRWIEEQSPTMHALFEILVFSYLYLIVFLIFGRSRTNIKANLHLQVLSLFIVFTCIGVNRLVVDSAVGNVYFDIAACLYAILCCVFALIIQFTVTKWQQADTERLLTAQLFTESKKQYEQWSVNAGMIKQWIHDLRHLMNRIENMASQKQVDIPDISRVKAAVDRISPTARTGNDALDVLLRNMDDLCRRNNIELQCVAYADCLKVFDGMKLYFLFANAIDNAMESVSGIEDPEKRLIDISIRAFGDSASIHIWNYFKGPITFSEGLPVTNKDRESHGFGMKSMQRIVDEFDGVMQAGTQGEVFNLDIMLPVPAEKKKQ